MTISTLAGYVSTMFGTFISLIGDVADCIADEPILLFFCVLPVVGIAVGLFKRLINVN